MALKAASQSETNLHTDAIVTLHPLVMEQKFK